MISTVNERHKLPTNMPIYFSFTIRALLTFMLQHEARKRRRRTTRKQKKRNGSSKKNEVECTEKRMQNGEKRSHRSPPAPITTTVVGKDPFIKLIASSRTPMNVYNRSSFSLSFLYKSKSSRVASSAVESEEPSFTGGKEVGTISLSLSALLPPPCSAVRPSASPSVGKKVR